MTDQELNEASYLLFQKVKMAIAIVLIKSTPQNMNVENYAAMFQDKFRKQSRRINLYLEKKLFYEQLLMLLPAFKLSSSQELKEFSEPMEIDQEGDDGASVYQPKIYNWRNVNDEYFLKTINSLIQFLDAIIKAQWLSNNAEMLVKKDVIELISTCEEFNVRKYTEEKNYRENSCKVSCGLLKYIMKTVRVDKIIKESIPLIIKLTQNYLKSFDTGFINQGNINALKRVNEVFLNFATIYPDHEQIELIIEFIKTSTRDIFMKLSLHQFNGLYWYGMFGCWKQHDLMCSVIIDTLLNIITVLMENEVETSQEKYKPILDLLKKMLNSYSKLNLTAMTFSLPTNHSQKLQECHGKREVEQKLRIDHWEKIVRTFLLNSRLKTRPNVQISWTCLKIIILMKCRLNNKFYQNKCMKPE